jgi:LysR family cyn operon transcriptional activator
VPVMKSRLLRLEVCTVSCLFLVHFFEFGALVDLRQLDMLLAVVDSGSYAKAGNDLRVSHSAIHRQIRLLEHEVGDRILVRSGRRVKLTETGEILLQLGRRLRQEVAAAERKIKERNQLNSGNLRIGTGTMMLVFFLPLILERFRKKYPGIEVQVLTGSSDFVLEGIQKGQLDLGIILMSNDARAPTGPLIREVLYQAEFVLAVSKKHPLASKKAVSLRELVEYPFIMHPKTTNVRRVFDRIFADAGLTPRISMELENEEAMETMIEINMGVALLSRKRAVSDHLHHLRIVGRRIYCDVALVFADRAYIPRAVDEFSKICRSVSSTRAHM